MPKTKLEIYLTAERERVKGNIDAALAGYREALALDANDWKIRECVAEALYAKEDVRGALKELFTAAHRLIWQQSYADATRLLQKMRRLDPAQEHDISKGVQACLDDIAMSLKENSDELPVDGDWGSTKEFLESLVLSESSAAFRIPDAMLEETDRIPVIIPQRLSLSFGGGRPIPVEGKEFRIGRGRDCHLIVQEGVVSRHHSRILEMDGHYILCNWESRNGTLLNGTAVDQAELSDADVITFGLSGPEAVVHLAPAPR